MEDKAADSACRENRQQPQVLQQQLQFSGADDLETPAFARKAASVFENSLPRCIRLEDVFRNITVEHKNLINDATRQTPLDDGSDAEISDCINLQEGDREAVRSQVNNEQPVVEEPADGVKPVTLLFSPDPAPVLLPSTTPRSSSTLAQLAASGKSPSLSKTQMKFQLENSNYTA